MNTGQEAFFAMALKVRNFGVKNTAAIATIPAITPFFTQHSGLVTQLITADAGSRADLSGYAIAKAAKRTTLESLSLKVSNAVTSHSVIINDTVLQKRADFPASKWYSSSEEELVTQATIVKNLATPLGAALAPYGVTVADITALNTALNAFTDAISDPTLAIDQRKEDNVKVDDTINEIQSLLNDKLDILMRSFEVGNPSLYSLYRSARAIDVNGSAVAPTTVVELAAGVIKTVATTSPYDPDTIYTLQNMGNEAVQFSLSTVNDEEGETVVLLNAGETRSRLAENLSSKGVYLVVNNPSEVTVPLRIWVE